VTDANVLLGRIDAERPIGGKLERLDRGAAEAAVRRHVAEPLGLEPIAAAEAIVRVANSRMAGAIRLVSVERGHDPRRFAIMAFGGGGALHAGALLREVGLARALVPRFPGITSALGCVIADMRHDFVLTLNALLADLDLEALNAEMARAEAEGRALLARAGVEFEAETAVFKLDMLYLGQTHTVAAALPVAAGAVTREAILAAFEGAYLAAYGRLLQGLPVRVMNLRTAVIGRRPKFDLELLAPASDLTVAGARRGARPVWVDGGWAEAAVYDRLALPVGALVPGPAVLEQADATTFVEPDLRAEVDRLGNLVLRRKEAT
jgi:N-methylhydantoinase A